MSTEGDGRGPRSLGATDEQRAPLPRRTDGRNVNPEIGTLSGEGAQQLVDRFTREHPSPTVVRELPSHFPNQASPTYYDQPMLKAPVWLWMIPAYLYVGGVAGATSVLGAAVSLRPGKFERLGRAARWIGTIGDGISAVLLIADLGRPARFLHMMRVFRITSPMNLGTWVLSASGALNSASLVWAERRGSLGRLGRAAELGAGVMGLPLSTYTGVLLANTAVPVWQLGHRVLPMLFGGSAAASAADVLQLLPLSEREHRLVSRFGIAGKCVTLVAGDAFERAVKRVPEAARPLREGTSGRLWQAGRVLTAASLVCSVLGGSRRPWARTAGAWLGTAGALAMRFGLTRAGHVSTRNPRASFQQQREGLGAAEVCGGTRDPQTQKPFSFALPMVR